MVPRVLGERAPFASESEAERRIHDARLTEAQPDVEDRLHGDLGPRQPAPLQVERIAEHSGGLVTDGRASAPVKIRAASRNDTGSGPVSV